MRAPSIALFLLACTLPTVSLLGESTGTVVVVEQQAAITYEHPKQVGGAVSAPTLIHAVEMPGLARMSSELVLNLWVDAEGVPSHIRVLQGGDLAQNEKIISAVRQYRFKPAMENGKPVLVEMNLEVSVD
jgi:TonB family protein